MSSFNKTNLQNIKDIFEKKTGVELVSHRRRPIGVSVLVAAAMVCCLTMTAFAVSPQRQSL